MSEQEKKIKNGLDTVSIYIYIILFNYFRLKALIF